MEYIKVAGSEGISWVVSVSFPLHLPPDQSNACTEYATSLSGLSGFLSGLLHPTGFAWGKIKTNT